MSLIIFLATIRALDKTITILKSILNALFLEFSAIGKQVYDNFIDRYNSPLNSILISAIVTHGFDTRSIDTVHLSSAQLDVSV